MDGSAKPADISKRFATYAERREAEALSAILPGYDTLVDRSGPDLIALRSEWTDGLFGGPFFRSADGTQPGLPVVNLVFVQSRNGNTIAADPSDLGGGATDKHLVYEGLSRIDADAVLAGATTAGSRSLVLSIWHPQLVALRLARGKPRHPRQVVVTATGDLPLEDGLMFAMPELGACLIASTRIVPELRRRLAGKPWVDIIDAGEPLSMVHGLQQLHDRGIRVVSAIGGRRTAQALLEARTIADLYLTTSAIDAGVPNTPFYTGPSLPLDLVVEKAGRGIEAGVRFHHYRTAGLQPRRWDNYDSGDCGVRP
ncbi:MAG TPA: dihydrofolate reductase family protein [Vicinamibacterales bacterium]|nr:dihydrofolate reductase family protein [Vicinamibacterales bacterium]